MTTANADLQQERSLATFDVERLTNLLDGGIAKTVRRRHLESIVSRDPTGIFSNDDNPYLHRTDRHVRSLAKFVRLIEICRSIGVGSEPKCDGHVLFSEDFPILVQAAGDDFPLALHWIMFVPNLMSLGDDEQRAQWLPLVRDWKMIGCYAQTELGHGSNVRGLETTATFVPESKGGLKGGSFTIHSPTITSSKFWPGTLGRTANHAVVIARLIDGEGIDRGVHNFLVPLRSMIDHSLLPGIETGDIGPKIGYNNMDNGFARFENVVVPRRNMLMRFAEIDERGKYAAKTMTDASSKIAYITMMQVRAYIVNEAGKNLAMAATIAVRYSAVRRQGFADDEPNGEGAASDEEEVQILDYRQQQHRLLPHLAASYCFHFTGSRVLDRLESIERRLVSGTGPAVTKPEVADLHASTSGLKSFTTTVAAEGIEDCRRSCGGHGFLQSSGLPELYGTYLQNPTVEGDNHMLPQQVVKVLLKLVRAVRSGDEGAVRQYEPCDSRYLVAPLKAMLGGKPSERCAAKTAEDMKDPTVLLSAFRHRAARLLAEVATQIHASVASGRPFREAWNDGLVQMARVSRAHSLALLLDNFVSGVNDEERRLGRGGGDDLDGTSPLLGEPEIAVLRDLCVLFGSYWIERDVGDFLEDGYLSSKQARWVRSNVLSTLDAVRPNAVALVDARDFTDFRLKSALGRYDGDVYPAIMKSAKRDPLNAKEIGPGYEEHLKRLIADGVGACAGTASRL